MAYVGVGEGRRRNWRAVCIGFSSGRAEGRADILGRADIFAKLQTIFAKIGGLR